MFEMKDKQSEHKKDGWGGGGDGGEKVVRGRGRERRSNMKMERDQIKGNALICAGERMKNQGHFL